MKKMLKFVFQLFALGLSDQSTTGESQDYHNITIMLWRHFLLIFAHFIFFILHLLWRLCLHSPPSHHSQLHGAAGFKQLAFLCHLHQHLHLHWAFFYSGHRQSQAEEVEEEGEANGSKWTHWWRRGILTTHVWIGDKCRKPVGQRNLVCVT